MKRIANFFSALGLALFALVAQAVTVTAGTTGTYTFAVGESAAITLDANERAQVNVLSSTGAQRYSASVSESRTLGPFAAGDVLSITAQRGDIDYVITGTSSGSTPSLSPSQALAGAAPLAISADGAFIAPGGSEVGYGPPLIDPGTVTTDRLVAWTAALSTARMWYAAEDALNIAALPAASGDSIYSVPNRMTTTARVSGSALTLRPLATSGGVGIAANAPIRRGAQALNGYFPLGFGTAVSGGSTMRLGTVGGALDPSKVYRIFAVAAMRGTAFPYLMSVSGVAGNSLVSGNGSRQLRAGTDSQVFGTFTDSAAFLLSLERPGTEQLFDNAVAVSSLTGRLNGTQVTTQGTAAASGTSDAAFVIGNRWDADVATDLDWWETIVFEGKMTQGEVRRVEGYLAWKYGLQTQLPGDHPYRSRAPMVPAATTAAAQFDVLSSPWGWRQVVQGYLFSIADDNIAAGDGAQGTDHSRSLLYDLAPSEGKRLAKTVMRGAGPIRLGLGIYYRGNLNLDGTSGLYKNIGPGLPSQRQRIYEFVQDAQLPGIAPEYWSPAPHWKTTSAYGNGTLWAGGANARGVTLDSIRVSDASGYAAQIDAFTNAIVTDLENLHGDDTYPLRVVAFGLQNEPLGTDASYGSCTYTPTLYVDVLKKLIPKIRNSAILSKWGGNPNTVAIHADSWGGPSDTIATALVADNGNLLSTGKSALGELAMWTYHNAGTSNTDANVILTGNGANSDATGQPYYGFRVAATNPTGIPATRNEYEFFSNIGRPAQFANLVANWLNELNWLKSPQITLIHAGKPSTDTVSERYALTVWRVPGDDGAVSTDYATGLDYGKFSIVDANFNAAKAFIRRIKNAQWLLTQETAYSSTKKVGSFIDRQGKLNVFALNSGTAADRFTINLGAAARTMRCQLYSATQRDVYVGQGATTTNVLDLTIAAQTLDVCVEI